MFQRKTNIFSCDIDFPRIFHSLFLALLQIWKTIQLTAMLINILAWWNSHSENELEFGWTRKWERKMRATDGKWKAGITEDGKWSIEILNCVYVNKNFRLTIFSSAIFPSRRRSARKRRKEKIIRKYLRWTFRWNLRWTFSLHTQNLFFENIHFNISCERMNERKEKWRRNTHDELARNS